MRRTGDRSDTAATFETTRFGRVEIPAEAVIEFPHGLIGLQGRRWALVARSRDSAFQWLQSLELPGLALPVIDPKRFFPRFRLELSPDDAARGLPDVDAAAVYATVRAAEALGGFHANLRAPILIAEGRAHQVINEAPGSSLREPLFAELTTEAA